MTNEELRRGMQLSDEELEELWNRIPKPEVEVEPSPFNIFNLLLSVGFWAAFLFIVALACHMAWGGGK